MGPGERSESLVDWKGDEAGIGRDSLPLLSKSSVIILVDGEEGREDAVYDSIDYDDGSRLSFG